MNDYIVRATAANAQIRAFAMTSRALVEEARRIHNLSPVITAALGRLLTAGAMMGSMLKGDKDVLTMQIHCDGPVLSLIHHLTLPTKDTRCRSRWSPYH